MDYEYQTNVIYANVDTIYLQYISNSAQFGGNLARWPAAFSQFAQAYMAVQAQPTIVNSDSVAAKLEKELIIAERVALTSDGLNKPIQVNPIGRWNKARLYNYPANGITGLTVGNGS